ncbi:MAG: 50S ribosomal protein L25 [Phycisphaerae bacterium]|nr:50S ribosomal protein L25 [Phycisphaerae bacterium]
MSHETPTIAANQRQQVGTRYARRLRQAGRIPAVIYGHGKDPMAIEMDEKETLTQLHMGSHVINIDVDGGSVETCLVKDLQFGYLGDNVIHLDLTRVNLDEEVTVNVQLNFSGSPEASKKPGNILVFDMNELEVRCKVRDIPEEIKVDLGNMLESYNVGELTLPDGVEALTEPETSVARIQFVQEEDLDQEAAEIEGDSSPEVIGESDAKADGDGGGEESSSD